MEKLADSLNSIVRRVADFFEILDLSFLVSGFASIFAIVYWFYSNERTVALYVKGWPLYFAVLIICYIVGLMCFAGGRFIRRKMLRRVLPFNFEDYDFKKLIKSHGLNNIDKFRIYESSSNHSSTMSRMWSELRQNSNYGYSLPFLKKYWVISTTYDGLIFSSIIWISVFVDLRWGLIGESLRVSTLQMIVLFLVLCFGAYLCAYMASKYDEYQVEELFASVAAEEGR